MSDSAATRDGFGKELVELGRENEKIVVVSADLEDSTRAEYFKEAFPERFFSVGIAEQDMVATAAGLAMQGFTVFINSFAVFLTNRAYDMIRMDLCYNDTNVKVMCSHAGLTVGEDGASAQCLEDIAIMRVLPNMKVVCPVDVVEARKATRAFAEEHGPMYMRLTRGVVPTLTSEKDPFIIGKANMMRDGKDVTIIACGTLVSESLKAAVRLAQEEGIQARVINMHTIKPIDEKAIIAAAKETGAIVTAEEHQINGGLGSAVAEAVARNAPVPMEMVAVNDKFGMSGKPAQLLDRYGLNENGIVEAVKKAVKKKREVLA